MGYFICDILEDSFLTGRICHSTIITIHLMVNFVSVSVILAWRRRERELKLRSLSQKVVQPALIIYKWFGYEKWDVEPTTIICKVRKEKEKTQCFQRMVAHLICNHHHKHKASQIWEKPELLPHNTLLLVSYNLGAYLMMGKFHI